MSRGVANDVIQRFATAHPHSSWTAMREELAKRFAQVSDPDHAFALLRELRQGRLESARMVSERLLDLAEEAFRGQENQPLIERQLVRFYIDTLQEES